MRVKVLKRVSGRDADRAAGGFVRVGAAYARVCGAQRCARALGANGDLHAARDEDMREEGTRASYATLSVYDERRATTRLTDDFFTPVLRYTERFSWHNRACLNSRRR